MKWEKLIRPKIRAISDEIHVVFYASFIEMLTRSRSSLKVFLHVRLDLPFFLFPSIFHDITYFECLVSGLLRT